MYQMFCLDCHKTAMPERLMPGSVLLEAALWLAGIGLGIFFSWWAIAPAVLWTIVRIAMRKSVCKHCQSSRLVLPDSDVAVTIKKELRAAEAAAEQP